MSPIPPEAVLLLAGMTLAHAAWNVSDLPAGELLVPLAFVQEAEGVELHRFEAESQEKAIAEGKKRAREWTAKGKPWAFARDGIMRVEGKPVDVLTLEFWAPGMESPVVLVQKYRPFSDPAGFKLLGASQVVIDSSVDESERAAAISAGVLRGVAQHRHVSALWSKWQ